MTWPNEAPKNVNGGYQALCPTHGPIGPETPDQEKSRAIFAEHWKKVHAAQGIPQMPKAPKL